LTNTNYIVIIEFWWENILEEYKIMPKKGRIDPGEYQIRKYGKNQFQILKEMLEEFVGKEIVISSNMERIKGNAKRIITVYHIGQEYNELGQVLTLNNPSLPREDIPRILVSPNMQVSKEEKKVIIRYPREISFRSLRKPTLPDLEIYIEEVEK
jgi:hypothetical protein